MSLIVTVTPWHLKLLFPWNV